MYKILIVEDEDTIRKGLIFMVDWLKVNCVVAGEAADGEEGLEKIKEICPDIVITDVKMPFKNGIQMLEESINIYGYEAIIISGYSEFEYAKKAITLNVTEYLLKPIDFEHLYQTIEKLTGKIKANQKMREFIKSQDQIHIDPILDAQGMQSSKTKYVSKMLEYIKVSYSQKISLNDLSRKYGLSSTYLNAKFKKETNYTFNDFLNRYRVLQAVELLKQEKMKVYEIAKAVGFQDYKYFIQVFKKYVGCSPSKFLSTCVYSHE
ncbi:MAG: two component transcriptional regulator, AraC family [Pelosinus sp.]|jgi:two-component system response regulator YesN|nr:two component transcriptional regulator, AraC family [Pelosinus sp.]